MSAGNDTHRRGSGGKDTVMLNIINLTPHPVTILRPGREPVTYPACEPTRLPRAMESTTDLDDERMGIGDMALSSPASDSQGCYENYWSLESTGLVDFVGYVGVEGLPAFAAGERMFGVGQFYIVSIVTAIGALAGGRGIEDLLVPMGQVRDAQGRIIGASGLAPATALLTPMYQSVTSHLHGRLVKALRERNDARRALEAAPRATADA